MPALQLNRGFKIETLLSAGRPRQITKSVSEGNGFIVLVYALAENRYISIACPRRIWTLRGEKYRVQGKNSRDT